MGEAGEFFTYGVPTTAAGFAVFEMLPDIQSQLCLRSVAHGNKFCTLGQDACAFGSHTKKIDVNMNSLYIARPKNSAFTHHYLATLKLSQSQPLEFLMEHHLVEEWVHLFETFKNYEEVMEEAEMAGVKKRALGTKATTITPQKWAII